MTLSRWKIALYVGLVFVSGALLGAFSHRLYTVSGVSANAPRNPEEFRRRYMEEMKSRLKLTADQVTQLSAILDETRSRVRSTRESIEPEIRKIRDEQQEKIHQILSADQRPEYDQMRLEREAEIKRRGPRPPR
jgi:Spy/CpxP family protein refolding chaperone